MAYPTILVGGTLSGVLSSTETQDIIQFTAEAGKTYNIRVSSSSGMTPYVSISGSSSGTRSIYLINNTIVYAIANWVCAVSGIYTITISAYTGSLIQTGAYTAYLFLNSSSVPLAIDPPEPVEPVIELPTAPPLPSDPRYEEYIAAQEEPDPEPVSVPGAISGTITDHLGNPLECKVVARNQNTHAISNTTTSNSEDGSYSVSAMTLVPHYVTALYNSEQIKVKQNIYSEEITTWTMDSAWLNSGGSIPLPDLSTDFIQSFVLKPDETRLYGIGKLAATIYEYSFSVTDNVPTIELLGTVSLTLDSPIDSSKLAAGLYFKPDGTRMYVAYGANYQFIEYAMSSAWDLSTLYQTGQKFSVSASIRNIGNIIIPPSGTSIIFIDEYTGGDIYQYSLPVAWSLSGTHTSMYVLNADANSMTFNSDGTEFIISKGSNKISSYPLSTPYILSTLGSVVDKDITPVYAGEDMFFTDSNSILWMRTNGINNKFSGGYLVPFNLSVADDISTAALNSNISTIAITSFDPGVAKSFEDIVVKDDGTKIITQTNIPAKITGATFGTPYQVDTLVVDTIETSGLDGVRDLYMFPDGLKLWAVKGTENIHELTLGSAWDVSTKAASWTQKNDVFSYNSDLYGIDFSLDGSLFFALDDGTNYLYSMTCSTPYEPDDIYLAHPNSTYISISAINFIYPRGMKFNSAGTELYVFDNYHYNYPALFHKLKFSVPWDITSYYGVETISINEMGMIGGVPSGFDIVQGHLITAGSSLITFDII